VDCATINGGFPLPPAGEPVRVVDCHHSTCDADTRVRLPGVVPSRAVRRVVCQRCEEPYQPERVAVVSDRRSRSLSWQWLSLPVAAVAVVGGLLVLQGGEESESVPPPAPPVGAPDGADAPSRRSSGPGKVPKDAQLISESTFQLALPPGWKRTTATGGATFAAAAPAGEADVMLWIEEDRKLDFASFEARSLDQLESLAGSAGVVERNPGPTPETTSITIAPTSVPEGAPDYEVLLRSSGDYWYYLATTSQPGASPEVTNGIALVQGSFLPQGSAR
jgi:hypothetical protein